VDQPVHAILAMCNLDIIKVFSRISRDYKKNISLLTGNNKSNRTRQDYNKAYISQFISPFVFSKMALKPQICTIPNLVYTKTYVFPTYSPKFSSIGHCFPSQTVRLPKLLTCKTAVVRTKKTALIYEALLTKISNQQK
jgi:hypothetical protein